MRVVLQPFAAVATLSVAKGMIENDMTHWEALFRDPERTRQSARAQQLETSRILRKRRQCQAARLSSILSPQRKAGIPVSARLPVAPPCSPPTRFRPRLAPYRGARQSYVRSRSIGNENLAQHRARPPASRPDVAATRFDLFIQSVPFLALTFRDRREYLLRFELLWRASLASRVERVASSTSTVYGTIQIGYGISSRPAARA
eukprot:6202421-Pleurochrysis_carterae.AAC.1